MRDNRSRQAKARERLERDVRAAITEAAGEILQGGGGSEIPARLILAQKHNLASKILETIGRNWRFVSRARQQITLEDRS